MVQRELAEDAVSEAYEGMHVLLPRRVLLKVLQPHLVGVQSIAVQMMREGCILEALHHAGVPRVYECGMTIDRRPWLALEVISGPTLDDEVKRQRFSIKDTIALIKNVAEILAHAHSRGVVHRNLRPGSIVRDNADLRGFPLCIIDWGDARTLDATVPQEAPELGQYYRAPEILCGDPFDGRADVFALGVIAYEALTGHLPALPIARRCPNAPPALTRLIDSMLSIDPITRPSAFEVADDVKYIVEIVANVEGDSVVQPVEEVLLLTDLSRDAVPEPVRERPRWTPPYDLGDNPDAARQAADPLKRRTRSLRDDI